MKPHLSSLFPMAIRKSKALAIKIAGVEPADKMTEGQMVAKGKKIILLGVS